MAQDINLFCETIDNLIQDLNHSLSKNEYEEIEDSIISRFNHLKQELNNLTLNELNQDLILDKLILLSLTETCRSKLLILIGVINILIKKNKTKDNLNSKNISILFECCKCELDSSASYYNNDILSQWKQTICYLIDYNQNSLQKNIQQIQGYFE
jgi:hypothetical protein